MQHLGPLGQHEMVFQVNCCGQVRMTKPENEMAFVSFGPLSAIGKESCPSGFPIDLLLHAECHHQCCPSIKELLLELPFSIIVARNEKCTPLSLPVRSQWVPPEHIRGSAMLSGFPTEVCARLSRLGSRVKCSICCANRKGSKAHVRLAIIRTLHPLSNTPLYVPKQANTMEKEAL